MSKTTPAALEAAHIAAAAGANNAVSTNLDLGEVSAAKSDANGDAYGDVNGDEVAATTEDDTTQQQNTSQRGSVVGSRPSSSSSTKDKNKLPSSHSNAKQNSEVKQLGAVNLRTVSKTQPMSAAGNGKKSHRASNSKNVSEPVKVPAPTSSAAILDFVETSSLASADTDPLQQQSQQQLHQELGTDTSSVAAVSGTDNSSERHAAADAAAATSGAGSGGGTAVTSPMSLQTSLMIASSVPGSALIRNDTTATGGVAIGTVTAAGTAAAAGGGVGAGAVSSGSSVHSIGSAGAGASGSVSSVHSSNTDIHRGVASALDWLLTQQQQQRIDADTKLEIISAVKSTTAAVQSKQATLDQRSNKDNTTAAVSTTVAALSGSRDMVGGGGIDDDVEGMYLTSNALKQRLIDRYLSLLVIHHRCQYRQSAAAAVVFTNDKKTIRAAAVEHDHSFSADGSGNDFYGYEYDEVESSDQQQQQQQKKMKMKNENEQEEEEMLWQQQIRKCIGYVGLADCYITDDDLNQILSWLRKIECRNIWQLDMHGNCITGEGLMRIVTWILSVPDDQIRSNDATEQPLLIDLSCNKIMKDDMLALGSLLRHRLRSEFHFVAAEDGGNVVSVYGQPLEQQQETEQQQKQQQKQQQLPQQQQQRVKKIKDSSNPSSRLLLKIDMKNQNVFETKPKPDNVISDLILIPQPEVALEAEAAAAARKKERSRKVPLHGPYSPMYDELSTEQEIIKRRDQHLHPVPRDAILSPYE